MGKDGIKKEEMAILYSWRKCAGCNFTKKIEGLYILCKKCRAEREDRNIKLTNFKKGACD